MIVGQFHWDAGRGDDFGSRLRRPLRSKPRVIADKHSALGLLVFQYIGSDCASNPPYIVKCKVVGNDPAPTVGSELDLLWHLFLRLQY